MIGFLTLTLKMFSDDWVFNTYFENVSEMLFCVKHYS